MLSLLYTNLQFIYYTLIHISFSHSLNFFFLITRLLFKSWYEGAALLLLLLFLPVPAEADDLSTTRITMKISAWYPPNTMIVEMTIQNPRMSLFGDHPGKQSARGHLKQLSQSFQWWSRHVYSVLLNNAMFVNPSATNPVKTTQIHSLWYEEITSNVPAQRYSDPPHANISVVNESSQRLFPSLTWCIRLSQILLAPVQQWYTAASLQLTPFREFEPSRLNRSRQW